MPIPTLEFDVIIVGAGPAGSACALALKDAGLRVAMLDKNTFPRDKICGDAIPAPAIQALRSLDPTYVNALRERVVDSQVRTSRVVAPKGAEASFQWVLEAYNSPRMEFDSFLVDLVKEHTQTDCFFGVPLEDVTVSEEGVVVKTADTVFQARIVIGCDGVHSIVAKKLAHFTVDRNHFCGAVRIYFSDIAGSDPSRNEFFFSRKMMPGYFWLFPVAGNLYNVGFGMLSEAISRQKVNLEKGLFGVIEEFPELKERFAHAKVVSKPQGMGLPIGTRKLKLSGDRFLLCGDAASLIDPVSGAGIDNAILSGIMAAGHIRENWKDRNFSAESNRAYDQRVYKKLGKTLRRNTVILRMLSRFPFLLPMALRLLSFRFTRRSE